MASGSLDIVVKFADLVTALVAVVTVGYSISEYLSFRASKQVDVAVDAISKWDEANGPLTKPAMELLSLKKDKTDSIVKKIANSQKINLSEEMCRGKIYGFLVDDDFNITPEKVNEIRFALIKLLNAWETIAVHYNSGTASKKVLKSELVHRDKLKRDFSLLEPFIMSFEKRSWIQFEEMVKSECGPEFAQRI